MKNVGFNLLGLRMKERDVTMAWIAKRSGLSPTAVRNIFEHGAEPKLGTMIAIAKALGCNVQDIWPGLRDVI